MHVSLTSGLPLWPTESLETKNIKRVAIVPYVRHRRLSNTVGYPRKPTCFLTVWWLSRCVPLAAGCCHVDRLAQIWNGECPWGRVTTFQVMTKITLGEFPARPEGTKALGLTTKLWNNLTECWHANPEDRITIPEILEIICSTWVLSFIYKTEAFCVYLPYYPRHRTGSIASRSELSIGGTTITGTVGARKSASIRRRPSSIRDYQRSEPCAPPPRGNSSNDCSGPIGLSEKTGAVDV